MDEFPGLLAKDFGFRPQGKAAPMAASKGSSGGGGGGMSFGIGSDSEATRSSSNRGKSSSSWSSTPIGVGGNSFLDDQDGIFGSSVNQKPKDHGGYDDVFGGPPKYSDGGGGGGSFDYDSIFHKDSSGGGKRSNSPVFDKPVYDDDIFDGVPGLKPTSKYEDVFSSISSPPKKSSNYDDLLGDFGVKQAEPEKSTTGKKRSGEVDKNVSDFDDLLPGFGGSSPPKNRTSSETRGSQHSTVPTPKTAPSVVEDPFVVLESASAPSHASSGLFTEPLEQTDKPSRSGRTKSDVSSPGGLFDDMDPLSFAKSVPSFSSEANNRDRSHSKNGRNTSYTQSSVGEESTDRSFAETAESFSRKKTHVEDYRESHQTLFDMPTVSTDSHKAFARNGSRPYANASPTETHSQVISPKSEDNSEAADDVWLTVSEIPLFTQPTSAPPPSRPPPPRPGQSSKTAKGSFSAVNSKNANEFPSFSSFSQNSRRPETIPDSAKSSGMPSMDELEDFAMGRRQSNADERGEALSSEEDVETNSAAATAAMKEAMDRAEAKFKHAREMRERENAKVVRNRGVLQDRDEKATQDAEEREHREKQERLDRERREREDKEREQKRLEKERERAREIERGKARQAVERATKEARDRAAVEARQRAERAAFEKAKSEARERDRAAVQRAHAEARERAAAEARERAERAAAEAKERANSDAREKAAAAARAESEARRRAERAAADRAAAEARERAAAEAREKATAAARGNQNKSNENDLESFFGMGNRPSSAPKSRTPPTDPTSHPQFHNRTVPEGAQWSSTGTSSTMRKASSTTNIVDDLTSIFGGTTQSSGGEFQDIEGETEERRRARLERHQRTQERAKKALAEKNERDLQNQRDQAERHRIAETLDVEIKRWAAGKEGNLRALLSTLQYVLWPECGWQLISLTDLITSASVKKAYRKATLCIHPDKVQQKGANLQQKYIAEKVFDLLKGCKLVKAIECQLSNSSFSNLP